MLADWAAGCPTLCPTAKFMSSIRPRRGVHSPQRKRPRPRRVGRNRGLDAPPDERCHTMSNRSETVDHDVVADLDAGGGLRRYICECGEIIMCHYEIRDEAWAFHLEQIPA